MTDGWPAGWYVVVSGPPGSGKTTLATALAPALGLPLIVGIRAATGAPSTGPPH